MSSRMLHSTAPIMKKLSYLYTFVWILVSIVCACHPEFKRISDNVTLPCDSLLPIGEAVLWWFNNETQVDSSFSPSITLSRPHGRSITILPDDVSVYGDYSCSFANGTFIKCYSLYIQG